MYFPPGHPRERNVAGLTPGAVGRRSRSRPGGHGECTVVRVSGGKIETARRRRTTARRSRAVGEIVMEAGTLSEIRTEPIRGSRCFVHVAPFAPHVLETEALYHRDCYEPWYRRRFHRAPRLVPDGEPHRFRCAGITRPGERSEGQLAEARCGDDPLASAVDSKSRPSAGSPFVAILRRCPIPPGGLGQFLRGDGSSVRRWPAQNPPGI